MVSWWQNLLAAVKSASEVVIAVYMYDEPKLQKLLVTRLRDRSSFSLTVLLDKEVFLQGKTPKKQSGCVKELQKCGAQVFLVGGVERYGSFHTKEVIVNRRY